MDKMIKNNKKVDLIFTDPPYNISKSKRKFTRKDAKDVEQNFGKWDIFETWDDYLKWVKQWIDRSYDILNDKGSLLIYCGDGMLLRIKQIIDDNKWFIKRVITWHKTNPTPQFMKINYLSSCEYILWLTKVKNGFTYNFKDQKNMHSFISTNDEEGFTCCIQTPICMGKERKEGGHPTQKRIDITKHFIEIHTNENDIVFDPFCGVGTTAIAAKELNRQYICSDISNEYVNKAKERVSTMI